MLILKKLIVMKILIQNIIIFFLFAGLISSAGCTKMISIDPPVDQLPSSSIFSDSATAQAAVSGMYSFMYNGSTQLGQGSSIFNFRTTTLPARSADELMPVQSGLDNFANNSLLPNLQDLTDFWVSVYSTIYNANSIIKGAQASTALSASLKQQITGEAKFVRAFCHFYLVNYFGKVPLILTTDVDVNNTLGASAEDKIYAQIIQDLSDARDALATDYSWSGGDRTRVNTWTASAMLARVYLYHGQWAQAETEATRVITQTGLYELLGDPNSVFLANSREAIWQFYSNTYGYVQLANQFIFTGQSIPTYTIDSVLYNSFEPGDSRKSKWIGSASAFGTVYTFPYKYKSLTSDNSEFDMVIRLAEVYLIRAEARAQQNSLSTAQSDLNAIRTRAGLPPTTATDQASTLTAIIHERQIELFCEWGHRWLDLKRTGLADPILGKEKPAGWQSTDTLYPIPQSVISTNPNLTQNNGYH